MRHFLTAAAGFGAQALAPEMPCILKLGDARIRKFHADGLLAGQDVDVPDPALNIGDRGPEVRHLQERLNVFGAGLKVDGIYGPATHASGIAGPKPRPS